MTPSALEAALLAAHAANDQHALARLYSQAADHAETLDDTEAACFFLTHAYVFALECGSSSAGPLNRRLSAYGREEPQPDL